MIKYVFNRCKSSLWLVIIIMFLSTISSILGNYIYKFIGFVIDYGLNYKSGHSSELSFLFSGKFGDYGSIQLIITLVVCMGLSALFSYITIYYIYFLQE